MALLIISFVAGVLTVLAPCVLPLLPVVIGSSASGRSRFTPFIVVGSLAISIIIFTFLLKVSTAFISIPPQVWSYLSGTILIFFGLTLLFPGLWERMPGVSRFSIGSNKLVGSGYQRKNFWGDVIIGMALGPVFSTCSPTYFVILASVLPVSFALGTFYLLAYVVGLSLSLLLLASIGNRFSGRMESLSNPHGYFKRSLGILFIVVAIFISFGYDKVLQKTILDLGFFDVTALEQSLLQRFDKESTADGVRPYVEIVNPSGFVNTDGVSLGELVGDKVILLDFMTYTCINCQRTFPYLNAWYEKYQNYGLEIVGIHTPEFAFEKDLKNVKDAMEKYGIKFPVVLDNDYATWNAYGNNYWPRKYLIDITGNIVYDHIGEGNYDETERKIKELLMQRKAETGEAGMIDKSLVSLDYSIDAESPETYFGSYRNALLANGSKGIVGIQNFSPPTSFSRDLLYLGGKWNIREEYAESDTNSSVFYKYQSKEVYIVAESDLSGEIEVFQDGVKVLEDDRGTDVLNSGIMNISESRLYKVIRNNSSGEHLLELKVKKGKVKLYAFTFG